MDRYPSSSSSLSRASSTSREAGSRETSYNGFIKDEVTVSGGRAGAPRKQPADYWDNSRVDGGRDEYYEDDEDYGMPPPSRSR